MRRTWGRQMDTKSSYTERLEAAVAKKKEELSAYEPYTPDEMFQFRGKDLFSVEDFWKYAYSQLDGMAETIAEFLVAKALGIEKAENVNYWTAYDMTYRNKRIEVKATSYVHPWNKEISKIRTFSIARQTTATGKTTIPSRSCRGSQRYMCSA